MTWLKRSRPLKRSKPMARSRIKRGGLPGRVTRPGADPAYKAWIHTQPCVALRMGGFAAGCEGAIQQSHSRNLRGPTGIGRKEPDRDSIPMCARIHSLWELRHGVFLGWSNDYRRCWMLDQIAHYNAKFDAEHTAATTPGFSSVPVEPLPPCEACEGEGCDKCF